MIFNKKECRLDTPPRETDIKKLQRIVNKEYNQNFFFGLTEYPYDRAVIALPLRNDYNEICGYHINICNDCIHRTEDVIDEVARLVIELTESFCEEGWRERRDNLSKFLKEEYVKVDKNETRRKGILFR